MGNVIKVGMADLNVCVSPDSITTLGLGSCVGIALRDPVTKIGGLAHVMLPDSTIIRNNTNIPKFADTGIEELVKQGNITESEARVHPQKNIITRALGTDMQVNADYFEITVEKGDIVLLCSDGLCANGGEE